ncbi:MAG: cohesin domain-containing protein, partial [Halobacteriota archaeon]
MKHIPGISDRRNRIATIAIVIVLALASIAGVVAVSPVAGDAGPTQADADLQVELEDVSAEPGETVVVPLSIDSSSEEAREILGYDFGVSWNQSVLELVEVRDTGFADPVVNTDEPGSVRFNAVAPDGVETPIEPVELVFEVDADADSETSLSFDTSVSEISETDGRDTVEWIDGSVSVTGGTDT